MTDVKKIPVLAIITVMVIAGAFVVADSATSDADGGGGGQPNRCAPVQH